MGGSGEPHGVAGAGPSAADGLLLAGDIGGTKTILGIYSQDAGPQRPQPSGPTSVTQVPVAGGDRPTEFLATVHLLVDQACFDLAGPISGGRATLTNLPWEPIEAPALAEALGLDSVRLLNDLEAIAGHHRVAPEESARAAAPPAGRRRGDRGRRARDRSRRPSASGTAIGTFPAPPRADMATSPLGTNAKRSCSCTCRPATATSAGSCSGLGIANLYDFLADTGFATESDPVASRIAAAPDRTRAIVEAGMDPQSGSALCAETLRLFSGILGAKAGNLALTVLATGGIYLAGGIPGGPAAASQRSFLARLRAKGRLSRLVAAMPVYVVVGPAARWATAGLRPPDDGPIRGDRQACRSPGVRQDRSCPWLSHLHRSRDISRPSGRWSVQVRLPVRRYAAGWAGNRLVERMMLGRGQRWSIVVALFGLIVPEPCLAWLEAADHRVPGGHRVRAGVLRR